MSTPATNADHLSVNGHDVAALIHGEPGPQPPVVCLHGLASSLGIWEAALPGWPADRCRIDLSLPGHYPGTFPPHIKASDIDDRMFADVVEGALEQILGSQPVFVIGWSTGGFTAFSLAVHHPRRVAAIASLAGFAGNPLQGLIGWAVWFAQGRRLRRRAFRMGLRRAMRSRSSYRWLTECLAADPGSCKTVEVRAILDDAFEDFRHNDLESLVKLFAAVPDWSIQQFGQLQLPVLIAGGSDDPIIRPAASRQLAAAIPGAELKLWDQAGHLIFCEWGGLTEYLLEWLDRIKARLPQSAIEADTDRADNEGQPDLAQRSHGA